MTVDPDEDFASWYKDGLDPDCYCERLYLWHLALWGRTVPGIAPFDLDVRYDRCYGIELRAVDGSQFWLGSDGIIQTWSTWKNGLAADLIAEIALDLDDFFRIASTIGGYILFPRNRPGQTGDTINQLRGRMRWSIGDRFDLTLECIRRHYSDPEAENPLGDRLRYYADFFSLFGDFDGYIRFFLLEDLVTPDRRAVRSLMSGDPLTGFSAAAIAANPAEYAGYRQRSIAFVAARNDRIRQLGM